MAGRHLAAPSIGPTIGRKGEESGMKRAIGFAVALLLASAAGGARAEEIQGKVKSLDPSQRAFTLEDGTKIWVAEGLSMVPLKQGTLVKTSYEERDGKKVATSIEVK
jgi:hypothetical protein